LHEVVEIFEIDAIKHLYAPPNGGVGAQESNLECEEHTFATAVGDHTCGGVHVQIWKIA
jgi:hypothetical protein